MRTRKEVAQLINSGELSDEKWELARLHHFGLFELRKLMDFIYEGEPKKDEYINTLDSV